MHGLQQEVEILQMMDHPNIIKLYDSYDVSSHMYLVTELMSGGELYDKIVEKVCYNEKEARDLCKILFEAVAYCHKRNIAHRDLKPENLLLKVSNSLQRHFSLVLFTTLFIFFSHFFLFLLVIV